MHVWGPEVGGGVVTGEVGWRRGGVGSLEWDRRVLGTGRGRGGGLRQWCWRNEGGLVNGGALAACGSTAGGATPGHGRRGNNPTSVTHQPPATELAIRLTSSPLPRRAGSSLMPTPQPQRAATPLTRIDAVGPPTCRLAPPTLPPAATLTARCSELPAASNDNGRDGAVPAVARRVFDLLDEVKAVEHLSEHCTHEE